MVFLQGYGEMLFILAVHQILQFQLYTAHGVAEPVSSSDPCEVGEWVIVRYLFYIIPRINLFYFSRYL